MEAAGLMFVPYRKRLLDEVANTDDTIRASLVTSAARAPAEEEAEHVVGAVGEPAFQNGWASRTGFGAVRFWKTSNGWVHLAGVAEAPAVAGASALPIFTLPTGYRPPFDQVDTKMMSVGERSTLWVTTQVDPQLGGFIRVSAEGQTGQGEVTAAFPFIFAVQKACVSLDGLSFAVS